MVIVYTFIVLTTLLLTMFIQGYRKSKDELKNKEIAFRQELIELIESKRERLTDQQKHHITILSGRKFTTYLHDNDLINHKDYNEILKRHFETE